MTEHTTTNILLPENKFSLPENLQDVAARHLMDVFEKNAPWEQMNVSDFVLGNKVITSRALRLYGYNPMLTNVLGFLRQRNCQGIPEPKIVRNDGIHS